MPSCTGRRQIRFRDFRIIAPRAYMHQNGAALFVRVYFDCGAGDGGFFGLMMFGLVERTFGFCERAFGFFDFMFGFSDNMFGLSVSRFGLSVILPGFAGLSPGTSGLSGKSTEPSPSLPCNLDSRLTNTVTSAVEISTLPSGSTTLADKRCSPRSMSLMVTAVLSDGFPWGLPSR